MKNLLELAHEIETMAKENNRLSKISADFILLQSEHNRFVEFIKAHYSAAIDEYKNQQISDLY